MSEEEDANLEDQRPEEPSAIPCAKPHNVRIAVLFGVAISAENEAELDRSFRFNLFSRYQPESPAIRDWKAVEEFRGVFGGDIEVSEVSPGTGTGKDSNLGNGEGDTMGGTSTSTSSRKRFWVFTTEVMVDRDLASFINLNPEFVAALGSPEEQFLAYHAVEISPLLDNKSRCISQCGEPIGFHFEHEPHTAHGNDPRLPCYHDSGNGICGNDVCGSGISGSGVSANTMGLCMNDVRGNAIHAEFEGFHMSVHVDKQLLNDRLISQLKPFTVKISSARCLPGTVFEEEESELNDLLVTQDGSVDRFKLSKRYCKPVYASFELFQGLPMARSVTTTCVPQGSQKVKLDHASTFLLGEMDPLLVAEYFQSKPLLVELHDRDVDIPIQPKDIFSSLSNSSHQETVKGEELAWIEYRRTWNKAMMAQEEEEENATEDGENFPKKEAAQAPSLFDVDKIAWETITRDHRAHMKKQCRGLATFSLGAICASSTDIVRKLRARRGESLPPFSVNNKAIKLKCVSNVAPLNRRISPNGRIEQAELDLSEEERLVRQPGRYFAANTELKIELSLVYPLLLHTDGHELELHPEEACCPEETLIFQRQIYIFAYANSTLLQKLRKLVDDINAKALPTAALRTHQFSEQEVDAAEKGTLDVVTGFQCVDDEFRVVVLEGLGAESMKLLAERIGRERANNDQYKVLSNVQQSFSKRLYTRFNLDLKVIRLREPLRLIVRFPEIYDHSKVNDDCYSSLQFLCEMRNATRLEFLKRGKS